MSKKNEKWEMMGENRKKQFTISGTSSPQIRRRKAWLSTHAKATMRRNLAKQEELICAFTLRTCEKLP